MLESQTFISRNRSVCISRVVILIIGILVVLEIQIILIIGSFLEFRRHIIISFNDAMAVDVMQFATFELNKSCALHSAQTNTAKANELKRTYIFANSNSVGRSVQVSLALECPKMQPNGSFILIKQHFVTAQFH